MKNFHIILFILFVGMGIDLAAQTRPPVGEGPARNRGSSVIDDSTRSLYGPSTALYNYEKNIIYQTDSFKTADTAVFDFHKDFHPLDDLEYTYHDLGNLGTPLNPIYQTTPEKIGARLGISVFDYYLIDPLEVKHYNTLSPYSWFTLVWGGGGRSKSNVSYTRNINPRWNFGGDFKGYYSDKQVARTRRGDRNAESVSFDFYTNYRSKNEKYMLFGVFDRTKHKIFDQGGVSVSDSSNTELYFSDFAGAYLTTARSTFSKNNVHLYHSYTLSPYLKVFHSVDRERRAIEFSVDTTEVGFFDYYNYPEDTLANDFNKFTELNNKIGFTGGKKGFYYSAYFMRRDISMKYKYIDADLYGIKTRLAEHYGGFETGFNIKEKLVLNSSGKVMTSGNFYWNAKLTSPWFEGGVTQSLYKPSFYESAYRGQFDYWANNFASSYFSSYRFKAFLGTKNIKVIPQIESNQYNNYITFVKTNDIEGQQHVLPVQAFENIFTFIPGLGVDVEIKGIRLEGVIKNNKKTGGSAGLMPLPDWFMFSRLTLHSFLFKDNLEIHAGIQLHWKSDYYGMGYDPAIQQYYVQKDVVIPNYWLSGVFLNAKMKRGLVFVRFNNIRQVLNPTGFFSAPYYRGEGPLLDFGFKMPFYD